MPDASTPWTPESAGTGVRFIGFGLAAGGGIFVAVLAVMHVVAFQGEAFVPDFDVAPHVSLFGLVVTGVAVACVVASAAAERVAVSKGLAKLAAGPSAADDRTRLFQLWAAATIVKLGLIEGPLAVAAIVFLIAADYLALGVAIVLLIVLLTKVPAPGVAEAFVEDQSPALAELRRPPVT